MKFFTHILAILSVVSLMGCAKDQDSSKTKEQQSQSGSSSEGTVVVERYDEGKSLRVDADFKDLEGKYSLESKSGSIDSLMGTALTSPTFDFSGSLASAGDRKFQMKFSHDPKTNQATLEVWDDSVRLFGNVSGSKDGFSWFVRKADGTRSYQVILLTKVESSSH